VTDNQTGEPLVNANIESLNNHTGTVTDESGGFTISLNIFPTTLVFSYIGYSCLKINLEVPPIGEVNVKLSIKVTSLSRVIVTTEKIDTIYKDNKYSVLDYELLDDGILLLIFKYKLSRSELLFKDYHGNEIAKLTLLPGKPLQLFRDCLGNTHIFTKTRSFQIYFDNDTIKLLQGVDIKPFKDVMGNCRFRAGDRLYFQQYKYENLIANYYSADTSIKKLKLFRTIADQNKMTLLSGLETFQEMNSNSISGITGGFDVMDGCSQINAEFESRFNKIAYLSPIYTPIERLGDTICIFNHPDSVIEFYNLSDSLIFITPIKYHLTKKQDPLRTFASVWAKAVKWDKNVIIDEQRQKIYTLFLRSDGLRILREIDMHSGKLSFAAKIPFPFVEKIKVRNDYLYYIYKGWSEQGKKKLFRQKIN